jgi:hypothetical protein
MSERELIFSYFMEIQDRLNSERYKAEEMIGRLPPQDPCSVRAHNLSEFKKMIGELWQKVEPAINTPDA